ncbi:hypothetical protein QFW96_21530, partial [Saccharopolyspora sp. TS4A08]
MFLVFVLVIPVFTGSSPAGGPGSSEDVRPGRGGADPAGPRRETPDEQGQGLLLSGVLPDEDWEVSEVPGELGPVGVSFLQERVP